MYGEIARVEPGVTVIVTPADDTTGVALAWVEFTLSPVVFAATTT
jgi:hypothetical protein